LGQDARIIATRLLRNVEEIIEKGELMEDQILADEYYIAG
jgi:hypothetical protein